MKASSVATISSKSCRLAKVAFAFIVNLPNAGCILENHASCNNADVKASIVDDAMMSMADALGTKGGVDQLKRNLADFALHDTFEASREGDVVSCGGTLHSSKGETQGFPDLQIKYQVARSSDGNVLYTFDKLNFGPAAAKLIILQGIALAVKQNATNNASEAATPPVGQSPTDNRHRVPKFADPHWTRYR